METDVLLSAAEGSIRRGDFVQARFFCDIALMLHGQPPLVLPVVDLSDDTVLDCFTEADTELES